MVLKLSFCFRQNCSPVHPERADQPEKKECSLHIPMLIKYDHCDPTQISPEEKEDDLDATDDGESSEEPHGASDETQLGLHLDLLVSLDVVEGRCVKIDVDQVQTGTQFLS